MKIRLTELFGGKPFSLDFEVGPADIVDANQELNGKISKEGLHITGAVTMLSRQKVQVELNVSGNLVFPCARCLKPTIYHCRETYQDTFTLDPEIGEFDLIPCVEECLFINEPYRVLCKPDCKGLCPRCGTDLNQGSCNCGNESEEDDGIDPRMAKLKALLDDQKSK